MKVIVLQPKLRFKHLLFARSSWGGLLNSSTAFSSLSYLFRNSAMHFCQVPVHVMIIDGMVVIVQSIEFRATTVLTLNAEETFHAIHIQSPSLLMIFSGGHYTELNYSVSFGKE